MRRKSFKTMAIGLFIAVGAIGLAPATAGADPMQPSGCAVPEFKPNQHVYVSADLRNNNKAPESLAGLESDIAREASKHNIQTYVVACQAEFNPDAPFKPAVSFVKEVKSAWQSNPEFDRNNFLVIGWVRKTSEPSRGSVAAGGGSTLQGYGLNEDWFNSSSGPVAKDIRRFMPNNPQGEFVNIVTLVNQDIDNRIQAAKDEQARQVQATKDKIARQEFMAKLPGRVFKGGSLLALIALSVFLFFRYRGKRSAAQTLIAIWDKKCENADKNWIELHGAYFDFLKEQGTDWASKFKGATLMAYTTSVVQFTDLTARRTIALNKLEQAQKSSHCIFPLTGGFDKAVALLSTSEITVTGDSLPMDVRDLFGSDVEEHHYMPEELLDEMSNLFSACNKGLSGIVKAFEGARENKNEIEEDMAAIEGVRQSLIENELTFDPYQQRYEQINTNQDAFLAILSADPLEAFANSASVKADAESLRTTLNRAIEIKKALPAVQAEIDKTSKRAAEVRGTIAVAKFPDSATALIKSVNFNLLEESGNPDPVIAQATQLLAAAHTALLAGELDNAVKKGAESTTVAKNAAQLVDTVLTAKAHIEETVPKVRTALAKLQQEIPAGTQDVSTLRGDFLEKNYPGQVANLTFANKVAESIGSELAKVQNAYNEQRYLAASANVDMNVADIQKGRDDIIEIHTRLVELSNLRDHSRSTIASAEQLTATLRDKLNTNKFTTAATTDEHYARLVPMVPVQKAEISQSITDWPATAIAADKLLAELQSVDSAIDQHKADNARAQSNIAAAASAVSAAANDVQHSDTREAAANQYSEAKQALSVAQAAISHAKSDWATIARQAQNSADSADKARQMARQDHNAANSARSDIASAESAISSANCHYGENVQADLGSANSALSSARADLARRNYEGASNNADSASNKARSAKSDAEDEVSSIIAARAKRKREEEEEEERQRQRDADAAAERQRQQDSSSVGGSNYNDGGVGGANY